MANYFTRDAIDRACVRYRCDIREGESLSDRRWADALTVTFCLQKLHCSQFTESGKKMVRLVSLLDRLDRAISVRPKTLTAYFQRLVGHHRWEVSTAGGTALLNVSYGPNLCVLLVGPSPFDLLGSSVIRPKDEPFVLEAIKGGMPPEALIDWLTDHYGWEVPVAV